MRMVQNLLTGPLCREDENLRMTVEKWNRSVRHLEALSEELVCVFLLTYYLWPLESAILLHMTKFVSHTIFVNAVTTDSFWYRTNCSSLYEIANSSDLYLCAFCHISSKFYFIILLQNSTSQKAVMEPMKKWVSSLVMWMILCDAVCVLTIIVNSPFLGMWL